LGFAVIQLDVSVVNVAFTPIGVALGGGVAGSQWIVAAYTVAFAALILTAGALGDRCGGKRMFIAGFGIFTVASAMCGLAFNLELLIAGRVLQGVGAAILGACSLVLLNHTYPEPGERARAVGLWAAGASGALSGGPLVGGVLIATLGWRSIFFINAPIGLVGIWLTARFAAETPRSRERGVDLWGQISVVVALMALAGAVIEGGSRGFTDPAVLAGLAVAAIAGAAFVLMEAKQPQPMLPLRLFRVSTFSSTAAIGLLVNVAFYGLIFVFSLFFQQTQHLSALATGLAFAPMTAAILVGNFAAARLARIAGARWVIGIGALLMAAGGAGLLGVAASTPYWTILAQLVALGLGLGLLVPAMTSALLGSVDKSFSGVASGTLNTTRQIGSVIGVALFGSLTAGAGLISGLHLSLAISIGLVLAVAALTPRIGKNAPA